MKEMYSKIRFKRKGALRKCLFLCCHFQVEIPERLFKKYVFVMYLIILSDHSKWQHCEKYCLMKWWECPGYTETISHYSVESLQACTAILYF